MKPIPIIFIGYGVIGRYEASQITPLNYDIYDPNLEPIVDGHNNIYLSKTVQSYDFAFICVPTPTTNGYCDTSIVKQVVNQIEAKIYIVKSTIIPGTTLELQQQYPDKHFVFSPEHYGATQHAKNFEYNFTILGGKKEDCVQVQQVLQRVYDARHRFIITDSTTAELSKYMLNSYLAMKVNFCNAFWEICNQYGTDYESLRECFIQDPRINPAHTFVYDDAPYWDSHCFNKDIPAIVNASGNELLKAIDQYNTHLKEKYKK